MKIGKSSRRFSASRGVKQLPMGNIIRALPGPEYHEFDSVSQESFWRSPWKLSPQSNRMGYRLQGQPLRRTTDREMLSHGLLPGVVQVPHQRPADCVDERCANHRRLSAYSLHY